MDKANHMCPPQTMPSSPLAPVHILVFIAVQTSTQISIHSLSVSWAWREGRQGSGRTGKDSVYQIASILRPFLCCFCLWFCYICSGKQRQFETKGLFSKQRAQEEGRKEKEGCVERKSAAQMRVRLLRAQEGINKVTISVHGSQRWGGRPFS